MAQLPSPTRVELQLLAESRLAEAEALIHGGFFDGAVYLAGYAVELAFKARICERLNSDYPTEFASFKTHAYGVLLKLAGLEAELNQKKLQDTAFATNWSLVATPGTSPVDNWSENWRYRPVGKVTAADAQRFIQALRDPASGVLTWLKTLW